MLVIFAPVSEKHPWLDRQIIGYLKHNYFKIFIVHCALHETRKASMLNEIVENHINKNFSDKQKAEMLALYEKLSEEERKRPEVYWNKRTDASAIGIVGDPKRKTKF